MTLSGIITFEMIVPRHYELKNSPQSTCSHAKDVQIRCTNDAMPGPCTDFQVSADTMQGYVPACLGNGFFEPTQCADSACWCSHPDGTVVTGTMVNFAEKERDVPFKCSINQVRLSNISLRPPGDMTC